MFLTKQGKLTKKCPSCKQNFLKNKGSACLKSCPEKQLEKTHHKALSKIVAYCLPKEKITIECPTNLSAKHFKLKGWGWTNDIVKIITIPWYTLRSKQEFFDTAVHEIGHLIAYQKKFSSRLQKILQTWHNLEIKQETTPSEENYQTLIKYLLRHEKEIELYLTESEKDKGGHWYQEWYLEYKKLFQKLLKSPYVKYAYGQTKPQDYFFKN